MKTDKSPIKSFETTIDENNYENYVPSISKNSTESEIDKVPYKWENPLLVEDVLMQQIQANVQLF